MLRDAASNATMASRKIHIAPADPETALRLLSAVMLEWDRLPATSQARIIREAHAMREDTGRRDIEVLMAFINAYKAPARQARLSKP
jgi:hypothetical protein